MINNAKKANVDDLIALCHIIDLYEKYNDGIIKLSIFGDKNDIVYNLKRLASGKFVFGHHLIKKFYRKNKLAIDTIDEYSSIYSFVNGEFSRNLNYFYCYIYSKKDRIDDILSLLDRFKNLGIKQLTLDEHREFNKCKFSYNLRSGIGLYYSDNMKLVPCYDDDVIQFTANNPNYIISYNSNYRISSTYSFANRISYSEKNWEPGITVTNLLFSYSILPNTIDREYIINSLKDLKEQHKSEFLITEEGIDLSIEINDLKKKYVDIKNVVESIKNNEVRRRNYKELGKLVDIIESKKRDLYKLENKIYSKLSEETIEQYKDDKVLRLVKKK